MGMCGLDKVAFVVGPESGLSTINHQLGSIGRKTILAAVAYSDFNGYWKISRYQVTYDRVSE